MKKYIIVYTAENFHSGSYRHNEIVEGELEEIRENIKNRMNTWLSFFIHNNKWAKYSDIMIYECVNEQLLLPKRDTRSE